MADYRFRASEEGVLILQVGIYKRPSPYSYEVGVLVWRDAKIEDIPVFDPFTNPQFCDRPQPRPIEMTGEETS